MDVLVINCGSSSLKYQLINTNTEEVLASGLCDRIGINGGQFTYKPKGGEKTTFRATIKNLTSSLTKLLRTTLLTSE